MAGIAQYGAREGRHVGYLRDDEEVFEGDRRA